LDLRSPQTCVWFLCHLLCFPPRSLHAPCRKLSLKSELSLRIVPAIPPFPPSSWASVPFAWPLPPLRPIMPHTPSFPDGFFPCRLFCCPTSPPPLSPPIFLLFSFKQLQSFWTFSFPLSTQDLGPAAPIPLLLVNYCTPPYFFSFFNPCLQCLLSDFCLAFCVLFLSFGPLRALLFITSTRDNSLLPPPPPHFPPPFRKSLVLRGPPTTVEMTAIRRMRNPSWVSFDPTPPTTTHTFFFPLSPSYGPHLV